MLNRLKALLSSSEPEDDQVLEDIEVIDLRNKLNTILDMCRRPTAYGRDTCMNSVRSDILELVGEKSFERKPAPEGYPPTEPEMIPRAIRLKHREERQSWIKERYNNHHRRWS